MKTVLVFSQSHLDFRISELASICDVLSINVDISSINAKSHVFLVDFEAVEDVERLLSRSMLVKSAFEQIFHANSYEDLHNLVENEGKSVLEKYDHPELSYSLRVCSIGRKKKLSPEIRIKEFLDHFTLEKSPVDLKSPKNEFYLVEEYENPTDEAPKKIYFGKLYNLQDRRYIGNTTMDPELSFIQANIAQVMPGELVLDPFVGTGGLILPAAHFGAFVLGTEINYQTARALGKTFPTRSFDEDRRRKYTGQFCAAKILRANSSP
ncbi:unnamed protein product [Caenorhabditis auriculariae]|uniref:tRNA (guanine(10)-N(2))-methyltransferase TRMT11 N-terminal domain-containing protein n=1 Tax=Caenorhabditis auriculariae TaxID=2777116 RepID=A0A8S1HSR6_9PELO|nr:unnamed protein product [Caenorhabditis auriculariae]